MRALFAALLVAPVVASGAQRPAASDTTPSLRYGVTASADTVTVGEQFEIRVRVRAPADATIRFPENPDTTDAIQGRDPRTILVSDTVQFLDLTAVYHVAAWDVGRQRARIGDVYITWGSVERRVPLDAVDVFVRSVLPADSTLRVPKPPRGLFEPRPFPWWLVALLVAAIATALAVWWWKRRRKRPPPVVVVDPYARAIRELNRVEAMGLVDAGERTRFVALVVEVLRDYLAARFPDASLALTSRELVSLMRSQAGVPNEQLSRILHEADLAKFAAFSLSEARARALARDIRAIVVQVHKAWQASQSSQPPARAAA